MGKAGKRKARAGETAACASRRVHRAELTAKKVIKPNKHMRKNARQEAAWAQPAPEHLVARLDIPKHNSKYHTYFEFAENTEKKKKLEYQITNDPNPPPGFEFVPIGSPALTNECKELSREHDAMIFIVSNSKEAGSRISEHVYRTGYHFRRIIVDEARQRVGKTYTTIPRFGFVDPIPDSQADINKQADAAIRDLFPRIPNMDRQSIIEHAFQKGGTFHGEPTVGLQPSVPLSRRVQLAVLAHIRHTHTRYDKLLRETSWVIARKVVEPVCLDVLVKWRGDEETGRDQMDEILREVVVITDSESGDDEDYRNDPEGSSDDEGEIISLGLGEDTCQPIHNTVQRKTIDAEISGNKSASKDKRSQRGFHRYRAAWEQAVRRQNPNTASSVSTHIDESSMQLRPQLGYEIDSTPSVHQFIQVPSHSPQDSHNDGTTMREEPVLSDRQTRYRTPNNHLTQRPGVSARFSNEYLSSPRHRDLHDMLIPSVEHVHLIKPSHTPNTERIDPLDSRAIIVIDDSPPVKRRRLIYEGNASRNDQIPLAENDTEMSCIRRESLIPISPRWPQEAARRMDVQLSGSFESLPRGADSYRSGGCFTQGMPVYNAPELSTTTCEVQHFQRPLINLMPEQARHLLPVRFDDRQGSLGEHRSSSFHQTRPHENIVVLDRRSSVTHSRSESSFARPMLPASPVLSRNCRSYSTTADRAFATRSPYRPQFAFAQSREYCESASHSQYNVGPGHHSRAYDLPWSQAPYSDSFVEYPASSGTRVNYTDYMENSGYRHETARRHDLPIQVQTLAQGLPHRPAARPLASVGIPRPRDVIWLDH